MTSLECNAPGTTAYSVCCDGRPYTIRAHAAGQVDLAFYSAEEMPNRDAAVWLYAPIAGNERVTEIWVRHWDTDTYIYHGTFIVSSCSPFLNNCPTPPTLLRPPCLIEIYGLLAADRSRSHPRLGLGPRGPWLRA